MRFTLVVSSLSLASLATSAFGRVALIPRGQKDSIEKGSSGFSKVKRAGGYCSGMQTDCLLGTRITFECCIQTYINTSGWNAAHPTADPTCYNEYLAAKSVCNGAYTTSLTSGAGGGDCTDNTCCQNVFVAATNVTPAQGKAYTTSCTPASPNNVFTYEVDVGDAADVEG